MGCKISWYGEKIWLKYQQLCVPRDIQYILSIILKAWTRCLIGLMIPPTCPSHSPSMFNLVWKNHTFISFFLSSTLESWLKLKAFVLSVQSSIYTIAEGRILWLKLWKSNSRTIAFLNFFFLPNSTIENFHQSWKKCTHRRSCLCDAAGQRNSPFPLIGKKSLRMEGSDLSFFYSHKNRNFT